MQELLVAGVEFPDLGMVKLEVEHPVPDLELSCPARRARPSNWDIHTSAEQYIEEIWLVDYIRAALVDSIVASRLCHQWWIRRSL